MYTYIHKKIVIGVVRKRSHSTLYVELTRCSDYANFQNNSSFRVFSLDCNGSTTGTLMLVCVCHCVHVNICKRFIVKDCDNK